MIGVLIAAAAALALAGCGEKPQSLGTAKQDMVVYQGTGTAYVAPGWKAGDKASWEQQLKTRTHGGQNDYSRVQ